MSGMAKLHGWRNMAGGSGGVRVGSTRSQRAQLNYLSIYAVGLSCTHKSTRKRTRSRGSGGSWGVSQGPWFACKRCCEVGVGKQVREGRYPSHTDSIAVNATSGGAKLTRACLSLDSARIANTAVSLGFPAGDFSV